MAQTSQAKSKSAKQVVTLSILVNLDLLDLRKIENHRWKSRMKRSKLWQNRWVKAPF